VLDAYAIALAQHVMPETFFTLALVGCAYLVTDPKRRPLPVAASGLVLGLALTMRSAALFAIPAWLAYVIWAYWGRRGIAIALAGLAAPVVVYASIRASAGHPVDPGRGFGLLGGEFGLVLYARVAPFADCRGAEIPPETRRLCEGRDKLSAIPSEYQWSEQSPARRLFGYDVTHRENELLREFAVAVIRAHPSAYVKRVGGDFLRYFNPSGGAVDPALELPAEAPYVFSDDPRRSAYLPDLTVGVHRPAGLMRDYYRFVHTPRRLLGVLLLIAFAALAAACARSRRIPIPHRREIFLFTGMAATMLVAAVASLELQVRYLMPLVPLVVAGGVLAVADLSSPVASLMAGRARQLRMRLAVRA
jgi:hypothetical protein